MVEFIVIAILYSYDCSIGLNKKILEIVSGIAY
jgi:hypothetical protein